MPYDIQKNGWEIYGEKVAEEPTAKNHKNQDSAVPLQVGLRDVCLFDVILGQLHGAKVV